MSPFLDPNSPDLDSTRLVAQPRRQRWWLGALTLIFLAMAGYGLALLIQAGMTSSSDNVPEAINYVCLVLGGFGKGAQYLYQGGWHASTFHQHEIGETVCKVVNAIIYTLLLLAWLLIPRSNRLRK
jgi:hypothetical protein